MTDASRRNFLTIAGAGVAAVGVAAVAPSAVSAATGSGSAPAAGIPSLPSGFTGAVAAYVHDVHAGEIAVMVEGREVVVTDHELVARLAQHLATAGL